MASPKRWETLPFPVAPPGVLAALAGAEASTSIAVARGGWVHHQRHAGRAEHAQSLLPLLDNLLAGLSLSPIDLGAVAFARGPGPFTGDRIVVASAQGLGLSLGIPLIPVSSLAAAAWASGQPRCAVALRAGQGKVYWGCFECLEGGGIRSLIEEQMATPSDLALPAEAKAGAAFWGVGNGWRELGEPLAQRLGPALVEQVPEAEVVAEAVAAVGGSEWRRGVAVPPTAALPTYLRPSYAERSR